jgi:hypothetical protein
VGGEPELRGSAVAAIPLALPRGVLGLGSLVARQRPSDLDLVARESAARIATRVALGRSGVDLLAICHFVLLVRLGVPQAESARLTVAIG